MRAAQITTLSGPAAITVDDIAEPTAADDQVVVAVHRAGVAYPDVLLSRGEYQLKPPTPFVPGAEVAGTVVSAPAESGLTVGQRVVAFPGFGGFAEQVAAPLTSVVPIPDDMTYDVAAALPMNYLTCLFALDQRAHIQRGDTVLVHGASGGIGTAAIQLAKARGARAIAVVSDPDARGGVAREAGADDVVAAATFKDDVRELTDGRGVDIVVDPVGGDRFTDSLRSLATEGRLLVIGFTGGEIPTVKVNRLLLNNISVVGVGWGAYWMTRPTFLQEQWKVLMHDWVAGAINPPIGATFSLDQVADAVAMLDDRRASGKVLINVAD